MFYIFITDVMMSEISSCCAPTSQIVPLRWRFVPQFPVVRFQARFLIGEVAFVLLFIIDDFTFFMFLYCFVVFKLAFKTFVLEYSYIRGMNVTKI